MDRQTSRFVRVWAVVMLVGGPLAFALPYLLPESASRFERSAALATLFLVAQFVAILISWVLDRRASGD